MIDCDKTDFFYLRHFHLFSGNFYNLLMRDTKTVEQSYLTDDQTGDGMGRVAIGTLVGVLTTAIILTVIVATVMFYKKNLYPDILSWINSLVSNTFKETTNTVTSFNEDSVTNCSANSASQDSNSCR